MGVRPRLQDKGDRANRTDAISHRSESVHSQTAQPLARDGCNNTGAASPRHLTGHVGFSIGNLTEHAHVQAAGRGRAPGPGPAGARPAL